MDITVFKQACKAYREADFQKALSYFVSCSYDIDSLPTAEKVKFLRLLGNCYMKTDNPSQGLESYTRAYADADDTVKPTLCISMGVAFSHLREYDKAIASFEEALKSPDFKTPYKAYDGIAQAQFCLQNWEDAGAAWREAALDENNPKPALSLVNLGLCFMKLSRPSDAIISYETALDLGLDGKSLCEAQANLGQAYVVEGRIKRAIAAFDAASEDGNYELSEMAAHDYELAKSLEKRLEAKVPHIFDTASFPAVQLNDSDDEDINAISSQQSSDQTAQDVGVHQNNASPAATAAAAAVAAASATQRNAQVASAQTFQGNQNFDEQDETDEFDPLAPSDYPHEEYAYAGDPSQTGSFYDEAYPSSPSLTGDIPNPNQSGFFDISEDYINSQAIESRKKARRAHGMGLKIAICIVILLILLVGAAIGAYALGYGYPTAESVTTQFFNAAQNQTNTDSYWDSSVNSDSRTSELATLTGVTGCSIESVQRSMSQTVVYIKATLKEGGDIYYEVQLVRNNIGWKVKYLGIYFPSKN